MSCAARYDDALAAVRHHPLGTGCRGILVITCPPTKLRLAGSDRHELDTDERAAASGQLITAGVGCLASVDTTVLVEHFLVTTSRCASADSEDLSC